LNYTTNKGLWVDRHWQTMLAELDSSNRMASANDDRLLTEFIRCGGSCGEQRTSGGERGSKTLGIKKPSPCGYLTIAFGAPYYSIMPRGTSMAS